MGSKIGLVKQIRRGRCAIGFVALDRNRNVVRKNATTQRKVVSAKLQRDPRSHVRGIIQEVRGYFTRRLSAVVCSVCVCGGPGASVMH